MNTYTTRIVIICITVLFAVALVSAAWVKVGNKSIVLIVGESIVTKKK